MTKQQAWERFAGSTRVLWVAVIDGVAEYRCGTDAELEYGDFSGNGPTPEEAIAAAFGEKITPTCDDCGYHDVQCHCEGLDDDDTTHRERYCSRSATGLDASECEGFKPLST